MEQSERSIWDDSLNPITMKTPIGHGNIWWNYIDREEVKRPNKVDNYLNR